jgi:hypothetical protein
VLDRATDIQGRPEYQVLDRTGGEGFSGFFLSLSNSNPAPYRCREF